MTTALMACNNDRTADDSTAADMEMTTTSGAESQVEPGTYVDLTTGKEVYIIKDESTGYATDSIAKVPVDFYINTTTNDTLYRTGMVVNNMLIEEDGKWKLDETKVKIDGDEIKIKDGDSKLKIDGEDSKEKDGDYKKKVDGDEVKIKDGDSKIKIEDGEVKKKND
ncbi:MAG TPA: hypothetical protein VLS94_01110 [Fusibacter sp.]|nr:hypothetical protein [Fusibacter sp.]